MDKELKLYDMTEKELIDGVVFSVVGTLHPTSIIEGRDEGTDYIAHVLWIPQTNKLIFKIWDKDGAVADPLEGFDERFPFDIVPYCGEKKADGEYGDIYTISISLKNAGFPPIEIVYDGYPIYPAIKWIILELIRLTNNSSSIYWLPFLPVK